MKRSAAVAVAALLCVVLAAGCESAPTTSAQQSPSSQVTQPAGGSAVNIGPAHDFFWGLTGDGYVPYTMYGTKEGEIMVTVVGVRVRADRRNRATYDTIYQHAIESAERYGIAGDEGDVLRVVLVEAAPGQKEIERRDFTPAARSAPQ